MTDIIPQAYWKLNESSGTIATDFSGNGYNGSLYNMEDADWQACKLSNGLRFEGTDERVIIDSNTPGDWEGNQAFTIEFWFKFTTTGLIRFMSKYNSAAGWDIWHWQAIGYGMVVSIYATGVKYIQKKVTATSNDGNWHHCVITYDGSLTAAGLIIYIDNAVPTQTVLKDTLDSTTIRHTTHVNLGQGNGYYFTGYLDEVIFYNQALSAANVTTRYNSGNGVEMQKLVGYTRKASDGSILGSCTCNLHKASDESFQKTYTSDAVTGLYQFWWLNAAYNATNSYVIAWSATSLQGVTLRTLVVV